MSEVYVYTKAKIPTSIGALLNYLRIWAQENRGDQEFFEQTQQKYRKPRYRRLK